MVTSDYSGSGEPPLVMWRKCPYDNMYSFLPPRYDGGGTNVKYTVSETATPPTNYEDLSRKRMREGCKTTNGIFAPEIRRHIRDAGDRRTSQTLYHSVNKRKSNHEAALRVWQRRHERMEGKGVPLRSHEEQEAPTLPDGSPQTLLSEMQTLQGSLKKTGASISPELTEVSQILQSGYLTKRKRNLLDRIVATIHGKLSTLRGGIDRLGEKIASLAGSIIDSSFLQPSRSTLTNS